MQIQLQRASLAGPSDKGAALPNGSSQGESEAEISFPHHDHRSLQAPCSHKASHALTTSAYIGSLPEIRPTINAHKATRWATV